MELGGDNRRTTAHNLAQDIQAQVDKLLVDQNDKAALNRLHQDARQLNRGKAFNHEVDRELTKIETQKHLPVISVSSEGEIAGWYPYDDKKSHYSPHKVVHASPSTYTVVEQMARRYSSEPAAKPAEAAEPARPAESAPARADGPGW